LDDDTLLTRYARDGSEAAFGQLVARHLSLVYSTCLRETGSPSLAEDAAQVVFLLLARKAKTLHAAPSLAGWLFNAARFVAKNVRKQEARRQRREQTVMQEMTQRQETPALEWGRVEPLLNDALAALKPQEREAVLLRFIEGHSLAETGAALALSEDAARMRVSRAVEKMRRYLTSHGAAVTGLVLTGFLTSEAARPVPAHAANVITQGTLQAFSVGPAANVLLLSKGVFRTMKIIKVKLAALVVVVLLTLIGLQIKHQRMLAKYNPLLATGRVGLPASGVPENDTQNGIPGKPSETMANAAVIFKNIEIYRRFHEGKYPADAAAMISDVVNKFKQYGQASGQDALRIYESADNRYSDDPRKRASESVIPWVICAERPDGGSLNDPKPSATKDVLAYTSLYYHEQIRRFNGFKDTVNPVGFYIVVWDDGSVERIPYQNVLYVLRPGTNQTYKGFPGEAGVPPTALTFAEHYKGIQKQK